MKLGPGGVARVDAATVRRASQRRARATPTLVVVGGKDGYVGRDGKLPEGESRAGGPLDG